MPVRTPRPLLAAALALLAILMLAMPSAASAAEPSTVSVRTDVQYGDQLGTPLLLDAYLPAATPTGSPAVIFVHGGAWNSGDKSEWAGAARDLVARTGWPSFSINYPLHSGAPFYYQHAAVQTSVDWLKAHAAEYGVDPNRIALVGASAGGHLAMLAGTLGTGPSTQPGRVRAVVSYSGVADMPLVVRTLGCQWVVCNPYGQAAGRAVQQYEVAPLASAYGRWYATSPAANVDPTDPPMFLVNSTTELTPLNQLQTMTSALTASGVRVQSYALSGSAHGMGYVSQVWLATIQFLQQQLA